MALWGMFASMWRKFFASYELPCFFGEPASPEAVSLMEQALSVVLPLDLRALLLEMDGVSIRPAFFNDSENEEDCLQVICSLNEIQRENEETYLWENTHKPAIAGSDNLLFFASEPNGDPIGYTVVNGKVVGPELIVMSHEDYGDRRVQCASLQEYLTTLLENCQ